MAIVPKIPPRQEQQVTPPTLPSLLALREQQGHAITGGATFESAWDALRANRSRSFLTMLGVIIGVSAVIAVVTLTLGVNKSVNDRFAGLGTNVLTISSGTTSSFGARTAAGTSQTLTLEDATAVAQLPHILNVSPIISTSTQVIFQDQNWDTSVRGVYTDYQTIQNWQIAEGAWFSDQDEQMGSPVAVLGQTVVQNLFTPVGVDPLGQTIRIGNQLFRVVGVLQAKGTQGAANADDVIFVPFSAAEQRLNPSIYVNQIQVQVDDIANVSSAQQEIMILLRTRHHLPGPDPALLQQNSSTGPRFSLFGGGGNFRRGQGGSSGRTAARQAADPPDDFQVFNGSQIVQAAQQNSVVLTILLIGIATISLAIGGIGIMNTMLISVTERRREIGLRMAIGARRRDIRNQFLIEAVMLSGVGGVLGIIIGLGGGLALTVGLGLPFVLSIIPALVAFFVSAIVGIAFGLYPAVSAAKLDPILALRTE
jgi:putative ABC transport system permease protein